MITHNRLIEFLKKEFERDLQNSPYDFARLHNNLEKTAIYNGLMPIPKAPIFHPYNPTGTTIEQEKAGTGGIAGTTITVKLPNNVIQFLPENLKKQIMDTKISSENIDCFFVTQNMPWQNTAKDKVALLLRPNYWLHGDKKTQDEAAKNGTLNARTVCQIAIFSTSDPNITIDNTKEMWGKPLNFDSHPGADAKGKKMTIISPDGIGILTGIDLNRTDSLISVVLTEAKPPHRLAITLHWLLNDADQLLIQNISEYCNNLADVIQEVATFKNSRLTNPNGPLSHLQKILNYKALDKNIDIKHSQDRSSQTDDKDKKTPKEMDKDQNNAKESKPNPTNPSFLEKDQDSAEQEKLLYKLTQKNLELKFKLQQIAVTNRQSKLQAIINPLINYASESSDNSPDKKAFVDDLEEMYALSAEMKSIISSVPANITQEYIDKINDKIKTWDDRIQLIEEKLNLIKIAIGSNASTTKAKK